MAKSWTEKFHNGSEPRVVTLSKPSGGVPAGKTMLIPTPAQVKAYIEALPEGASVPVTTLRADLAKTAGAETTCPLVTGIFLRIVTESALESGSDTPFWRVVDPESRLARKLSCGPDYIRERRRKEAISS